MWNVQVFFSCLEWLYSMLVTEGFVAMDVSGNLHMQASPEDGTAQLFFFFHLV